MNSINVTKYFDLIKELFGSDKEDTSNDNKLYVILCQMLADHSLAIALKKPN